MCKMTGLLQMRRETWVRERTGCNELRLVVYHHDLGLLSILIRYGHIIESMQWPRAIGKTWDAIHELY